MNPLYKILSISVISVICASKMYVQGKSLAFSSDVGTAYAKRGDHYVLYNDIKDSKEAKAVDSFRAKEKYK